MNRTTLVTATDESPPADTAERSRQALRTTKNNKTASIIISGKGGNGMLVRQVKAKQPIYQR